MINVNSSGSVEPFTGAYEKRLQQNRRRAEAEAYQAKKANEPTMTAKEYLGASVEISEESKEFLAGVHERKAAQRAAKEEAAAGLGENAFIGTGQLKPQYLVLSENLYNNGFYDNLSDDEVRDMENLLKNITSGMDSINGNGFNRDFTNEISHEAARLELTSSVEALKHFAEKYVPEDKRDSFLSLVNQYESYNSAKVAVHKNIYDLRDESMSGLGAPNASAYKSDETKANQEIGKVSHTKEEEDKNTQDYKDLFEQLRKKEADAGSIFKNLQNTMVSYASGSSKNNLVIQMLNTRNASSFNNISGYWSKLLG